MMLPLHVVASRCHPAVAAAALPHLRHWSSLPSTAATAAAQANSSCAAGGSGSSSSSNGASAAAAAAVAATAAAAAAVLGWSLPSTPAHADAVERCDINSSSKDAVALQASKRQRFADWLASHGSDVSAVKVQPSTDQGSGLGLFATPGIKQHIKHSWLGRRVGGLLLRGSANQTVTLSTIPLGLSITHETALAHPQLGGHFAELSGLGLVDERMAVVLLLLLERARGQDSPYAPWLQLLPDRLSTPLFWDDSQLAELSGTTLAAATAARRAALERSWQQLQPAVEGMLQQVGLSPATATYEDFLWANSIFWSRGLALPVAYTEQQQQQQQQEGDSSSSSSSSGVVRLRVLEGLVPGLDFANHSQQPKCWWEVEEAEGSQQQHQQQQPLLPGAPASQHVVKLMANRVCCPYPGEELTISYGDKGNEELLLLYGFAAPLNPSETLMLLCPLPSPEEWDEVFTARMELLQAKGLRQQLFLPASHLEAATGQPLLAAPAAPEPEADSSATAAAAATDSSSSKRSSRGISVIPESARQVLEVFVLDKRELAAALEQQQPGSGGAAANTSSSNSSSSSSGSEDPMQQRMQQLGLDMAVLTTFTRLLELKMIAMEGEGGTGPLEADLQQLAAAAAAEGRGGGSGSSKGGEGGEAALPAWKQHCLLYRSGQKALVRSYITAARGELQETLAELQGLMEANGYSS